MEDSKHGSAKFIVATATSVAATMMLMRTIVNEFFPIEIRGSILFVLGKLVRRFFSSTTMVIEENDGLLSNQMFSSINTYISYRTSSPTSRFKIIQHDNEAHFDIRVDPNQNITDVFRGVKFRWVLQTELIRYIKDPSRAFNSPVQKSFHCTFPAKHRNLFLNDYLPYISKQAEELMQGKKIIQIHKCGCSNYGEMWTSVGFDHPSTFETLALDDGVKDMILKDLDMFVNRKEYFNKVGRVWKRGYLLYGPPGTGKSSLIAAIANKLRFDIYELELTAVQSDSELKSMLLATKSRSILVVEDIDCSLELKDRQKALEEGQPQNVLIELSQMTLSGFLNCIDGLWASLGHERIIIFTTNHKERLDPALLRPGRMDVHVHLSYCSMFGFRALAKNYIGVKEHELFEEIEGMLPRARATPAEVAEHLMRCDNQPEQSLSNLIEFLQAKILRNQTEHDDEEDESPTNNAIVRSISGRGFYHRRRRGSYRY